jgi:hypothetical protein
MVWWFKFILVVHLIGVLLLAAAMAVHTAAALLMRHAANPADVRHALSLACWAPRIFAPSTALILLSGIYLSIVLVMHGAGYGWIVVSLIAVIALAWWGKQEGQRRGMKVGRLLADSGDTLSPALCSELQSPGAMVHIVLDVLVVAAIVALMVYRPDARVSVAIMIIALLAALAARAYITRPVGTAAVADEA